MKQIYRMTVAFVIALLVAAVSVSAGAADYDETRELFEKAGVGEMFSSAYGYALFPLVGKAGFVVGGSYGEGRVYEKGNYIGDTKLMQASIGFQLGGTGYSQVVFFRDQRALAEFISGNFEFDAEAQATVLTAAANVSAGTAGSSATASGTQNNVALADGGYYKGMATYAITKGGLMYEASIGGQTFTFNRR